MSNISRNEQARQAMRHQWFPVAREQDLAKPQSARLLGVDLVVWRGESGEIHVQSSRCPHRGASLACGEVRGESIACPYHGWQYGNAGKCTHVPSLADQSLIPPKARIDTYPCRLRYGHVWTCLDTPHFPLYELEEWRELDLTWLAGEILESPTGVAVAIENFADVSHFAYVHRGMMGDTSPLIEPLNVRREGLDVWQDRPLDAVSGEWAKDGHCMMHYHIVAPGFIAITYRYERLGTRIVAGFPCPEEYDKVRIFWGVANDRAYRGESLEECLRIEHLLYLEDLPIAETIRPREIDWDGKLMEPSVPADLFTMNYRRAFREFIEKAIAQRVEVQPAGATTL